MKRKLLVPTIAAKLLLEKLEALAERGVNGEKDAARVKLERLKKRYDFSIKIVMQADIFKGDFEKASESRVVCQISEVDTANVVKWALEAATGVEFGFRGSELVAGTTERTAGRLATIARTITESVETLWDRFSKSPGVNTADRALFIMGLGDGIMQIEHSPGQPLPKRVYKPIKSRAKRQAIGHVAGIHLHPYSVAVPLGKDIRFTVPLEEVTNRLNAAIIAALPQTT